MPASPHDPTLIIREWVPARFTTRMGEVKVGVVTGWQGSTCWVTWSEGVGKTYGDVIHARRVERLPEGEMPPGGAEAYRVNGTERTPTHW